MELKCKDFSELTTTELFEIYRLRAAVFVVEQNCAYQDVDEKDLRSYHLTLHENNALIGYLRIIIPGGSYPEPSIGRVVVAAHRRRNGAGRKLMEEGLREAERIFGKKEIVISAQTYLEKFYASMGFVSEGLQYLEDDIPHIQMRLPNKN
jgi:ElaA protein